MKKSLLLLCLLASVKITSAQAPNWLWAQGTGTGGYQYGKGIRAGKTSGDVFLGGRITLGTSNFGGIQVTASGYNVFQGRLQPSGNFVWANSYPYSAGFDYAEGFFVDDSDNVYSTGIVNSNSFYAHRYDKNGVETWKLTNVTANTQGMAITADKEGNIYIGGIFSGTTTFGTTTLNAAGGQDIFLLKYNKAGVFKWAKSMGGNGSDLVLSVVTDLAGNVYMSGGYTSTPAFGSIVLPASIGSGNFFLVKLDSSGTSTWGNSINNAGPVSSPYRGNDMTIDNGGNLYVTSSFTGTTQFGSHSLTSAGNSDIFVAKCANNGVWQWAKNAGGKGNSDEGMGIALDKDFDVYVSGTFQDTAKFSDSTLVSAGDMDIFVAKYANSTGDLYWAQRAGGIKGETAYSITVDGQKFVYITGSFMNTITFNTTTLNISSNDLFIAKLDTVPERKITVTPNSIYCVGTTSLPYNTKGNFNTGNVFTAELSDSTGSFLSPLNIGSVGATTSGNISITIPGGIALSNNYLIRVVSSNPAWSSNPSVAGKTSIGSTLNLTVSNDTTVCPGSVVQLMASGGSTYTWSPAVPLSCTSCSNPLAMPTVSTTFTVTASSGACTGSAQVAVNIGGTTIPGIINTPSDTVCLGTTASLHLIGFSTNYFQWQSSETHSNFADIVGASDSVYTTSPLLQTTYYRVVVGAGVCADTSASIAMAVVPNPVAFFTYNTTGLQVDFNASASVGAVLYLWTFAGGSPSTSTSPNVPVTYTTAGTYPVCLRILSLSGCDDTICRNITVGLPHKCSAYYSLFPTATPHTWIALNQTDAKAPVTYDWTWGDGNSSSGATPSHTYSKAGFYNICLTITDDTTCTSTYCDSSTYMYRQDEANAMVTVNVVSSLSTQAPAVSFSKAANLLVYPNPCKTCLLKGDADPSQLFVTDVMGKNIQTSFIKTGEGYTIYFPGNNKGMFLVKNNKTGEVVKLVRE